ncbi:MAG: gephyrin-like molybdotransferase Glp [Nitrospiria bacterium]
MRKDTNDQIQDHPSSPAKPANKEGNGLISVEAARKIILSEIHILGNEKVLLSESLGRTLFEEIRSPLNHPPWDTSAMDGYAVRTADTTNAAPEKTARLKIIEEIPAGTLPQKTVGAGEAAKIMTGAPMPKGADAVVKVEETTRREEIVEIHQVPEPGAFIRFKGEAVRKGEQVLNKGMRIRSAELAMMASLGKSVVPVFQRPRVAILSTGDELADLDEARGESKILNSNGYGLAAQVTEAGGLPINLGIARDDKDDLREKISNGLSADFLLISGGVSMGDYDFVTEVLESLGVALRFWKVAMKPGKPIAFGVRNGRPIFGLPGNPVSSMVTFEQFVRPAMLAASGRLDILRPTLMASLEAPLKKRPGRPQFARARVSVREGAYWVRSTGDQDSAILMSLVKANAFMILPPEGEMFKTGEKVPVQLLSEVALPSD